MPPGDFGMEDCKNYPELGTNAKTIVSDKNILGCSFNCKIITGHKIIDF